MFRTIPHPGEYGYETWEPDNYKNIDIGGANNWAGMAVDRERAIVYVPTGSAAYDFYGASRPGENLFPNTLLALDASTGEPYFPIEDRQVPISDIPGEQTWPTQPFPVKPAPYARQTLTQEDINPYAENRGRKIQSI